VEKQDNKTLHITSKGVVGGYSLSVQEHSQVRLGRRGENRRSVFAVSATLPYGIRDSHAIDHYESLLVGAKVPNRQLESARNAKYGASRELRWADVKKNLLTAPSCQ
jgi:transposase